MWGFSSELNQAEPPDRMLQEAWGKKTVDWEGQESLSLRISQGCWSVQEVQLSLQTARHQGA